MENVAKYDGFKPLRMDRFLVHSRQAVGLLEGDCQKILQFYQMKNNLIINIKKGCYNYNNLIIIPFQLPYD